MEGLYFENGKLTLKKDIKRPILKDNDHTGIIVEVYYAGVNPVDYKVLSYGKFIRKLKFLIGNVMGYDFSGRVVECGKRVSKLKVGDFVCGLAPGSHAQYVRTTEGEVSKKPAEIPLEKCGSFALASETVWQMFQEIIPGLCDSPRDKFFNFLRGQILIIIGATGGCGTFCVLLAKHYFGATVYAVCSEKNHGYAESLGADVCIDYNTEKFEDVVGEDLNVKKRVYGILDCFGGYPYSKRCCAFLSQIPKTFYSTCGAPNSTNGYVRTVYHYWKHFLSLVDSNHPKYSFVFLQPRGAIYTTILKILGGKKNLHERVPVEVFDLSQFAEVHDRLRGQVNTVGKLCLKIKSKERGEFLTEEEEEPIL